MQGKGKTSMCDPGLIAAWLRGLLVWIPWPWWCGERRCSMELNEEAEAREANANACDAIERLHADRVMLDTARETAHAVKNLNTTALHKLFEMLDIIKARGESRGIEFQRRGDTEGCVSIDATVASVAHAKSTDTTAAATDDPLSCLSEQIRQVIAMMSCAAHLTYQQSRVAGILRGEPAILTETLEAATKSWQDICGDRFYASPTARRLLVDRFRVMAVLSNAWGNALAHGDAERLNEVEISMRAVPPNSLEVRVSNWCRADDKSFDGVDKYTAELPTAPSGADYEYQSDAGLQFQGTSMHNDQKHLSAAKLTTHLGLAWMRRLCDGNLTLCSEGHGGRTVMTCVLPADHSPLSKRQTKQKDSETLPSLTRRLKMTRSIAKSEECRTTTSSSAILASHKVSKLLSLPMDGEKWDVFLAKRLLEEYGMVLVEDSRVLSLQILQGLSRSHGVGASGRLRAICGEKAIRLSEIKALEIGAATERAVLVCIDRNLGHGVDEQGRRVAMPHGDEVAARMRQLGYHGCIILQTGASRSEVEDFEEHYMGYYIDHVLGKQQVATRDAEEIRPLYTHIFLTFVKWLRRRFSLGGWVAKIHETRCNLHCNCQEFLVNTKAELARVHAIVDGSTPCCAERDGVNALDEVNIGKNKENQNTESIVCHLCMDKTRHTLNTLECLGAGMLHELLERWTLDTRASGEDQSSREDSSVLQATKRAVSSDATGLQRPTSREQLLREVKTMECIVEGVREIFLSFRSTQYTGRNACAERIDNHNSINANGAATVTGKTGLWRKDQAGAA